MRTSRGGVEAPDSTTALSGIKSKTKIADLFRNIKAFCKGCCTIGMLVNNCVTDNANLPLAASQGKYLMDQILSLNGRIGDIKYTGISDDLNVASNSIVQVMKYNMDTLNTPKTDGITVSGDGIVISYANSRYGIQVCAAQAIDTLFVRQKVDATWAKWKKLLNSDNVQFYNMSQLQVQKWSDKKYGFLFMDSDKIGVQLVVNKETKAVEVYAPED